MRVFKKVKREGQKYEKCLADKRCVASSWASGAAGLTLPGGGTAPARVFDSEAEALDALKRNMIKPNNVIVVRYEGPRGAPGLRELLLLTYYLRAAGLNESCAIVADGKFSGFAKGPFICQVTPEAAIGGPIAVAKDDDLIEIDIPNKRLNINISKEEMAKRLAEWKPKAPKVTGGILTLYARMANSCVAGAGLPLKI
ncbi:MAG: dihydroxy-acid dehydratase [Deltaproteobacteria bacterium]|nr:dihydroxy-acid dehydratase [Deltaproteobacteria bacterium]